MAVVVIDCHSIGREGGRETRHEEMVSVSHIMVVMSSTRVMICGMAGAEGPGCVCTGEAEAREGRKRGKEREREEREGKRERGKKEREGERGYERRCSNHPTIYLLCTSRTRTC